LIQTAGRAARHLGGECVLFCDVVTDSIQTLLNITEYRRTRQTEHNEAHGITPQSVKRALQQSLHTHEKELEHAENLNRSLVADDVQTYDKLRVIAEMEEEMREASSRLEFERAAHLRDQIAALKNPGTTTPMKSVKYPTGKSARKKRVSS
jgi:excinuclease ABC subunit B